MLRCREKGIGSANSLGNSTIFDSNKTEVLRLLLVLLSRQIYIPAVSLFTNPIVLFVAYRSKDAKTRCPYHPVFAAKHSHEF
jgi:hypothetical protein